MASPISSRSRSGAIPSASPDKTGSTSSSRSDCVVGFSSAKASTVDRGARLVSPSGAVLLCSRLVPGLSMISYK